MKTSNIFVSFYCAQEDCRRRRTPESVRFLGRRVYVGLVVVLITVMIHGLQPARVGRIRETLQIDSRTLKRWRQCWLDNFVRSGKRSMLCTNKLYLTPY